MFLRNKLLVAALMLTTVSTWCSAQTPYVPGASTYGTATPLQTTDNETPFLREKLALELAKAAAENGSQDLSLETFKRFVDNFANPEQPPPATARNLQSANPGVQSSLLGSPYADPFGGAAVVSRRTARGVLIDPTNFLPQAFELVQTWKAAGFDVEQISLALEHAVLPPSQPEMVRLLAFGMRQPAQTIVPRTVTTTVNTPNGPQTTTTTVLSTVGQPMASSSFSQAGLNTIQRFRSPNVVSALGFQMVDWASKAKRLDQVVAELEKRSTTPDGQFAHALIVYALRSQGRPDLAAQHVSKLLEQKQLAGNYWEMLIQSAMQPLAQDWQSNRLNFSDLSVATQLLPDDVRDQMLQYGLKADLIGAAPYFQYVIRKSIQNEDVKRLNELVPMFVSQVEAAAATVGGSGSIQNNIWNEVIAECYRTNRPYLALKALRYVQEKSAQNVPIPSTREEARMSALLALCDLPIEKRMVISQALILEETLTTPEAFHFTSFPDSQAPNYFRSPEWQAKARLLQADSEVGTISLLDVLLSDAETNGTLNETIDKLLQCLPEDVTAKEKLIRFLCEWISLRAQVRQQPVPERIVTESQKLAGGEAFQEWYLKSDAPIRSSLAARYKRNPDSEAGKFILDLANGKRIAATERLNISQSLNLPPAGSASSETLKHWIAIAVPEPPNSQNYAGFGYKPIPWYISADKKLQSVNSSAALLFKYPLQGNYSISVQMLQSGSDWSRHPFGGIINGTFLEYRGRSISGSRESLAAVSGRLTSSLNSTFRLNNSPNKTENVEVVCVYEDSRVTLSISGEKLAHAQFTSHSFPFAGLIPVIGPTQQGEFKFNGSPTIAKSVNLLDPAFSGWSARRYDRLLTNGLQLQPSDQPPPVAEPTPSNLASWKMENNELHSDGSLASGNRTSDPQMVVRKTHNCMLYARPLLDGERFEYEVWQDNNTPAAAPVIGLTALMLEGGRVRLHWLPTVREVQAGGIAIDNLADDPQAEQLSNAKLNNDQWNKVSLRIDGQHIVLSINGSDVYRRPIPANGTTEFGWLSDPEKPSIRIRNATLSGNWPSQLPADLWEAK